MNGPQQSSWWNSTLSHINLSSESAAEHVMKTLKPRGKVLKAQKIRNIREKQSILCWQPCRACKLPGQVQRFLVRFKMFRSSQARPVQDKCFHRLSVTSNPYLSLTREMLPLAIHRLLSHLSCRWYIFSSPMGFSGVGSFLFWSHFQILKTSQNWGFYTALYHKKCFGEVVIYTSLFSQHHTHREI